MAVRSNGLVREAAPARAATGSQAAPRHASVLAYILAAGILAVAGQIILKRGLAIQGMLQLTPASIPTTVLSLALNPLVILGLAVTVSGTFFWLILLSRVDLSYAYPFASLNYILILAASWLILGEPISGVRLLGVASICVGVCLIMRTPARSKTMPHLANGFSPASSRQ
jgi:drug/metabolite transporter (DMT)-like permease